MSLTPEQWHEFFMNPLIAVADGKDPMMWADEVESGLHGFTLDAIRATMEIDGELATDGEILVMILRLIETAKLAELKLGRQLS
jgi:hypothetical protein